MPYKMFCDECGYETSANYVSNRAIISWGEWKAEIILAHNGAWNDGILCENCLRFKLLERGSLCPKRQEYPDLPPAHLAHVGEQGPRERAYFEAQKAEDHEPYRFCCEKHYPLWKDK